MDTHLQHHTREFGVDELIHLVMAGRVGVPDFQRDFVWEPSQVVELFDSVSHGWPIGSLLVLQGPQPFGLKSIDDGPTLDPDDIEFYLLDGQQRVTALFHILTDAGDTVYFVKPGDLNDEGRPRVRWQRRELFEKRRDRADFIRLSDLADDRKFRDLTNPLDSATYIRLQELRDSTLGAIEAGEYKLPGIVMSREIDLEALTRIFETLNRTGVKLDAFDLMVAVMRRADFLLRQRWEEAVEEFPRLKAMKVEGIELLKLLALWQRDIDRDLSNRPASRRVRGVRQRDVLNVPPETITENWSRAVTAYTDALEFLDKEAGVAAPDCVPSWAMLLPLAYFMESGMAKSDLRRWYWHGIAAQTYAQGANTQVISDIDNGGRVDPRGIAGLETALLDSVKRNRILRLGIRGLARVLGQRDVLTGMPLGDSPIEISMGAAKGGMLATPGSEPLVDLGLTTAHSLAAARARLRSGHSLSLDAAAVRSQGFAVGGELAEHRESRLGVIAGWFREQI